MRALALPILAALLGAAPAFAQGTAQIGRSSGVVHGQSWNSGQQDLSGYNSSGAGARPTTRSDLVRQRAAAAQAQQRTTTQTTRAQTTTRRPTQQRTTQQRPRNTTASNAPASTAN
ncbi:hypothetical protein ACE7GA_22870 [Roseomonas sp. CCTCC AB2023176]|uniref:hypothetical protein n=1 Tax=Roseomonas sp. CCTCC AB2023176 TaxID=3342640 RepID=UPI0035E01088